MRKDKMNRTCLESRTLLMDKIEVGKKYSFERLVSDKIVGGMP